MAQNNFLYESFQIIKVKFINDSLETLQIDFTKTNSDPLVFNIDDYLERLCIEANLENSDGLKINSVSLEENLVYLQDKDCIFEFDIDELFDCLSNLDLDDDEDSPKGIEKFWHECPNTKIVHEFEVKVEVQIANADDL
jgi:hypothetical protein